MNQAANKAFEAFRARLDEAARLHREGNRKAAISRYRKLFEQQRRFPPLLNLLGLALVQNGESDEGLSLLDEAVRLAPEFPDAWLNLAFARHQAGDEKGAAEAYRQLLKLQPNNLTALLSYASMAVENDIREGTRLLRHAIAIAPDRALPWLRLRRVFLFLNNAAGIAEADRNIERLQPQTPEEFVGVAAIKLDKGETAEAYRLYRAAMDLQPNLAAAAMGMGLASFNSGDLAGALDACRRAAVLVPTLALPWTIQGRALLAMGQREAAAEALREAERLGGETLIIGHLLDVSLGERPAEAPATFTTLMREEQAGSYQAVHEREWDSRAPAKMAAALVDIFPGRQFDRFLDVGCGGGAVARALVYATRRRVGVDPSLRMVEVARRTDLYYDRPQQDFIAYFENTQERFDLIASADGLCYFGDLAPLIGHLASHLNSRGVLVVVTERLDEDAPESDYAVQWDGRYTHSDDYVVSLAEAQGLRTLRREPMRLRRERIAERDCCVFVFEAPA